MKIFELPNDIGINDFLKVLKNTVKEELLIHQKTSDSIYSLYSDSSINQAIDSIYCLDKSIYIPGYGINNKILRFIEYGGQGIEQTKILSKICRKISGKVNGDLYVF